MDETSSKVGRNDPCLCGSGRKYKRCCLRRDEDRQQTQNLSNTELGAAADLALEHDPTRRNEARSRLEVLLKEGTLGPGARISAQCVVAQTYQWAGEHNKALEVLGTISDLADQEPTALLWRDTLVATSQSQLRDPIAVAAFRAIVAQVERLNPDPGLKGAILVEAGRAFHRSGDSAGARQCWENAAALFEVHEKNGEHHVRTLSNLGALLLESQDEDERSRGIAQVEEASDIKARIGDWDGLANNHSILGLHFWRQGRFERALAYLRKDLALSRRVGNVHGVATTLSNLGQLYSDLKQFSQSRTALREAAEIADRLGDENLRGVMRLALERTDAMGRDAGLAGEPVGAAASCACGSRINYKECCGRADFEPIDLPWNVSGPSEDVKELADEMVAEGLEMQRLDIVLRHSDRVQERSAWNRIVSRDGWFEMHELPDVANLHLRAARSLATLPEDALDGVGGPLACLIVSVCALEAFINQVAFFVAEHNRDGKNKITGLADLDTDVGNFQRRTELTEKWLRIGSAVGEGDWPPAALWDEFKRLVGLRNELVHFKTTAYEQVIPPQAKLHEIIRNLPDGVEIRDIPHSWPFRLLTPSTAKWSVAVAERMIERLRNAYGSKRRSNGGVGR